MFSGIRPQLLCCRSAHNLNNLFSDLRLTHTVHSERQRINHVCGIVCGRIHGSHASGVLGGNRFEQPMKDLNAHVLRQERVEQLFRGLLVDVVHLCGCESGSLGIYPACATPTSPTRSIGSTFSTTSRCEITDLNSL